MLDGITEHVAGRYSQIETVVDQNRLIALVEQVADPPMAVIGKLSESAIEVAHIIRQICAGRLDDLVVMVAEAAFSKDADAMPLGTLDHDVEKSFTIVIVFKDQRLAIPPGHDVINPVKNVQSWSSWHGQLEINPDAIAKHVECRGFVSSRRYRSRKRPTNEWRAVGNIATAHQLTQL